MTTTSTPTSTATSTPNRTFRTRRFTAISGLVLTVASLVGFGSPASANEFKPAPVATFAPSCDPYGQVLVTLSNTAGLSAAHFNVGAKYRGSGGGWNIDVAPGATHVLEIAEGDATYVVDVFADDGYANATLLKVDCTQTQGTIALVCHGEVPMIKANATTSGVPTTLRFLVDNHLVDESSTGTASFTHAVVNGATYSASLETSTDGGIAQIEGIADCPPEPLVTIPEPGVTIPEPGITIPEPGVTIPAPAVTIPAGQPQDAVPTAQVTTTSLPSAALPSSPPIAGALPVTGTYSTAIAVIGAGLLGLGLLFLRATKRPLDS